VLVEIPHIVAKGPLQLAIRLWVIHRRMDKANAELVTERRQQAAFKGRAVIEHDGFGNSSPGTHRGNKAADGGTGIGIEEEVAENVTP
jgi:hypothetical protein